jgi:hypothetical protein
MGEAALGVIMSLVKWRGIEPGSLVLLTPESGWGCGYGDVAIPRAASPIWTTQRLLFISQGS